MPWWLQVITIIGTASGTIATVILGVQKARHERQSQREQNSRADRNDVITLLTDDRNYWRSRSEKAEAKVEALQQELNAVALSADHATDVAQAALLAFRRGTAKVTNESS